MIDTTRIERDCPHCAEPILSRAKVCKHCHRDVEPLQTPLGPDRPAEASAAPSALPVPPQPVPPERGAKLEREPLLDSRPEAAATSSPRNSRPGLATVWRVAAVGLLVSGMTQLGRYGEFDASVAVQLGAAAILATIDLRKRAGLQ